MKVLYTSLAREDMMHLLNFIGSESPKSALEILNKIESQILNLKLHPEIGRPGRVASTRELVITGTPFIVPYQVRSNTLVILRIYHSRRKWPEGF
jgi:toxin ParE1/3/4